MAIAGNEIDLSRYQSPELVEHVTEVVSPPNALWRILVWTAAGLVLLPALTYWLLRDHNQAVMAAMVVYAVFMGGFAGFLFGMVRLAHQVALSVANTVILSLELTRRIADDYRSVGRGERTVPPPARLFQKVIHELLLPTAERVLTKRFGFLAAPFRWLYRLTIGRVAGRLMRRFTSPATPQPDLEDDEPSALKETESRADQTPDDDATGAKQSAEAYDRELARMSEGTRRTTNWVVTLVFLLGYGMFALITALFYSPVLLTKLVAGAAA